MPPRSNIFQSYLTYYYGWIGISMNHGTTWLSRSHNPFHQIFVVFCWLGWWWKSGVFCSHAINNGSRWTTIHCLYQSTTSWKACADPWHGRHVRNKRQDVFVACCVCSFFGCCWLVFFWIYTSVFIRNCSPQQVQAICRRVMHLFSLISEYLITNIHFLLNQLEIEIDSTSGKLLRVTCKPHLQILAAMGNASGILKRMWI